MCLQAPTSTTTAKKRRPRPTQASSRMGRLRPQQLKWLTRMGTHMGHQRPQVGLVCLGCLGCLGWQAWLAGLQVSGCVCEADWQLCDRAQAGSPLLLAC